MVGIARRGSRGPSYTTVSKAAATAPLARVRRHSALVASCASLRDRRACSLVRNAAKSHARFIDALTVRRTSKCVDLWRASLRAVEETGIPHRTSWSAKKVRKKRRHQNRRCDPSGEAGYTDHGGCNELSFFCLGSRQYGAPAFGNRW